MKVRKKIPLIVWSLTGLQHRLVPLSSSILLTSNGYTGTLACITVDSKVSPSSRIVRYYNKFLTISTGILILFYQDIGIF
jgi:hypothetical protein